MKSKFFIKMLSFLQTSAAGNLPEQGQEWEISQENSSALEWLEKWFAAYHGWDSGVPTPKPLLLPQTETFIEDA